MFSFQSLRSEWKPVIEPSPNIVAVTSSAVSLVVSPVTFPEQTTQEVLVQDVVTEQQLSEWQTRPAESSGPLGYEATPQTSRDNFEALQADEATVQTSNDNLSRVDEAKVQTSNDASNDLAEGDKQQKTLDGGRKVADKVADKAADAKQARTSDSIKKKVAVPKAGSVPKRPRAPRATRVTPKATTTKATKESVQPPKENPRAKTSKSNSKSDSKSAQKRKRPAANKVNTRKRARGPFGRRRKATESSSEDDDDGVEVQRIRDDAFEIRFNHLYKPDAKLPVRVIDIGQYKGKFVSEVIVSGQEVRYGKQKWGYCGIAYLRWMLSDDFDPWPSQYKLMKAVRAHCKAYDRFMNSLEPVMTVASK
jgi:hypothetical protein